MALISAERHKTFRFNWILFVFVALLSFAGLLNLYSALHSWGGEEAHLLFWTQVVWVGLGSLVMLLLSFFDYRLLARVAWLFYLLSIVLLILVLIFGKVVAGHKSWLVVWGFNFQPTELAKLALIIILSRHFTARPRPQGVGLFELWRPFLYSILPSAMVVLQGDLGSMIFFVLIFATFAWFSGLKRSGIITLLLVSVIGAFTVYSFGLSNYQKARIRSFLHPAADTSGSGYHLTQSRIAVGSGQIVGKGYLGGHINKLRYLPEKHTDFVFPVLAEEWGFLGCMVVLVLYFLLFAGGIEVARKARDRMGFFLALGIVSFLFWHVVINLGGVLGLLPLTGVPLPFMSYGGSFTVVTLGSLGILFSIGMRRFLF